MSDEILQRIALWSSAARFDEDTRAEAKRIALDEEQAQRHFGSELSFGTAGLRGIYAVGSACMNQYTVARATQGLADFLRAQGGKKVIIGHDARHGSLAFTQIAAGVLAQNGLTAQIFPDICPTPLVSFGVRALAADAGIMITASHNPKEYNGYKVFGADGCQLTDVAAAQVTGAIDAVAYASLRWMEPAEAKAAGRYLDVPEGVMQDYLRATMHSRVTTEPIGDLSIVYTPLHGVGLKPVLAVLAEAGATHVQVVPSQEQPDGDFPTYAKPNPELPPALEEALKLARETDAALVLATDPDSDRVGTSVRTAKGQYALPTGNDMGLLLLEYLLSRRRENGTLGAHPVAITTIVSTDLTQKVGAAFGCEVRTVLTGFKYMGEQMGLLEKEGRLQDFVFAFEEAVGYLGGTHVRDKDGVLASLLIADMAKFYAGQGKTLMQALDGLYARYGYRFCRQVVLEIADAMPMQRMQAVMKRLRQNPPAVIAGAAITGAKDYAGGLDGLPPSDVLLFTTGQKDKVVVRPSGTEPKVKMYLTAEGPDAAQAHERLAQVEQAVRGWLS